MDIAAAMVRAFAFQQLVYGWLCGMLRDMFVNRVLWVSPHIDKPPLDMFFFHLRVEKGGENYFFAPVFLPTTFCFLI